MGTNGAATRPRIVYVGAERVGLACLRQLLKLRKHVVGVFTADEALRPRIADFVPFDAALAHSGVPLCSITDSNSPAFVRRVKALKPDVLIAISWSQRIPDALIDAVPRGCVGLHYALLPTRRGGAPLNWAILDGLTRSGITLFYMDRGLDTGDVIGQQRFAIGRHDTVKTLLDRVVRLAPRLLATHIDAIERGDAPRIAQDESLASSTARRTPEQSRIDRAQSDDELYAFIRALAPPYPSAFTHVGRRKLVIPSAKFRGGKLWIEGYFV